MITRIVCFYLSSFEFFNLVDPHLLIVFSSAWLEFCAREVNCIPEVLLDHKFATQSTDWIIEFGRSCTVYITQFYERTENAQMFCHFPVDLEPATLSHFVSEVCKNLRAFFFPFMIRCWGMHFVQCLYPPTFTSLPSQKDWTDCR